MAFRGQHVGLFHFGVDFATEEFKQDAHALAPGKVLRDDSLDSRHRAGDDGHFVARADLAFDHRDVHLVCLPAQPEDGVLADRGIAVAKSQDAADPHGVADFLVPLDEVKFGEEVSGKHRFLEPNRAALRRPFETQPRAKHFDSGHLAEVRRGDVFVLRAASQAEPTDFIWRVWRHGRAVRLRVADFFGSGCMNDAAPIFNHVFIFSTAAA